MDLKEKMNLLRINFSELTFTFAEAKSLWGQNDSTTTWSLWKMTKQGDINRLGKGIYTLAKRLPDYKPKISKVSVEAISILNSNKIEHFLSGFDVINDLVVDKPEFYPSMVFVRPGKLEETKKCLWDADAKLVVIAEDDVKEYYKFKDQPAFKFRKLILLMETNEMDFQTDGIALPEKAFVDLYYEVTKREYPYKLKKLASTYRNMKNKIKLDPVKMIRIASRRNLQYDIRRILEYELVNKKTDEFVEFLKISK